jgi:lipoprotein-anchoring transpeptidase ErfK/SrfK
MLNYKQKNAALTGEDYETNVNYWMPFFGNIGIHDASWRYAFGKEMYKNNGSHGCVNVPLNVAKTIYENIEEGTPIICYEE